MLSPGPAAAQRQADVRGFGAQGCGKYLADRAKKSVAFDQGYAGWVLGYLSAYNFFGTHKQVALPEPDTVLAYTDKYCRDNPLRYVANAADALIGDTGGWRPSAPN